jgi:hypothetical protein
VERNELLESHVSSRAHANICGEISPIFFPFFPTHSHSHTTILSIVEPLHHSHTPGACTHFAATPYISCYHNKPVSLLNHNTLYLPESLPRLFMSCCHTKPHPRLLLLTITHTFPVMCNPVPYLSMVVATTCSIICFMLFPSPELVPG